MHSRHVLLFVVLFVSNADCWFDVEDLDWSVRPVDDFYNFVNQRWINRTQIPATEVECGGLYTMQYENKFLLEKLLDDLIRTKETETSFLKRRLIDFYLAGLDEEAIERAGLEPVRETLVQLHHVQTSEELIGFLMNFYKRMNHGLIFEFEVEADDKNNSIHVANWQQTGIRLPERSYYFLNDSKSENIRENYILYIDRLLQLSNSMLNLTTNLNDAQDIFRLEAELARSHRTTTELRDPNLNYNKFHVNQLDKLMPNLHWPRILSTLTIKNQTILIAQPDYYLTLDKLIVSEPIDIWKNKIRFTLLDCLSKYLNRDFVQAQFHMFNYVINGQRKEKSRSMKIIEQINKYLGDLMGQLFVSRYFSFEAKKRTMELAENLIDVYQQRIVNLPWLSNSTKEKAIRKLQAMNVKLGFPSKWKTYSGVSIYRSSYFRSISSVFRYYYLEKMRKLRKLVDRSEWFIAPQTVNAFNYLSFNEIIFPAAILQEPFFSFDADDALNYGGIGYAIGHELTHALDDQGRKYDENGHVNAWWTSEDIQAFDNRTEMLVRQYDRYTIFNTHVNGRLTLGENIADLGGLEIAYQGFLRTKQAREGQLIDGFTPEQRFFFAVARIWRVKVTNERLVSDLKEERHPPAIFRVNGPLSNMLNFYRVFNVQKGDGMYREADDRVVIW